VSTQAFPTANSESPLVKLGQQIVLAGLGIYVISAPHSVAASVIGVALAGIGWLIKIIRTGSFGLRRSRFDLVILLSLLWSVVSALLSEAPRISIAKLTALWPVFLFYLTRAVLNRRSTLVLIALLILSGCFGAIYSVLDLVRGRGVVVETIGFNSPFHRGGIQPGDTIWRVNGRRVYSVADLDEVLKTIPENTPAAPGTGSRCTRSKGRSQGGAKGCPQGGAGTRSRRASPGCASCREPRPRWCCSGWWVGSPQTRWP